MEIPSYRQEPPNAESASLEKIVVICKPRAYAGIVLLGHVTSSDRVYDQEAHTEVSKRRLYAFQMRNSEFRASDVDVGESLLILAGLCTAGFDQRV
jgi:hypothetical protein